MEYPSVFDILEFSQFKMTDELTAKFLASAKATLTGVSAAESSVLKADMNELLSKDDILSATNKVFRKSSLTLFYSLISRLWRTPSVLWKNPQKS